MKDKLLQIINHYGINNQLKYIHSEYYELDEAIIKAEQFEPKSFIQLNVNVKNYINHIAEEIADVMVMLRQFQYYYGISDEDIEDVMKYKIDRQIKRMEDDN
jgi:NTP pyrophosphatase (non-canonical NTP hydrolase)